MIVGIIKAHAKEGIPMSKVIIELNSHQINEAVERLPDKEKLRLTEKLERETLGLRWKQILKDIDARIKKFPISQEDVLEEIRVYRRNKHAQGRH